jgi:VanZ family protein
MARRPTIIARTLLALSGAVCVVGMVGPFQGVEEALIPWDKAAHFVAFYILTALMYVAFPRRRRVDLTLLAVFAGAGIEIAQGLTGRDMGVGDMVANALGASAVLLPMYLQEWRAPRRVERRSGRLEIPAAAEPVPVPARVRP